MKGVIASPAIAEPLMRPMAPPEAITSATTAAVENPCLIRRAPTTLVRAMLEPTDRSMPPLTMMRVMPRAPTATITVWMKMILKL